MEDEEDKLDAELDDELIEDENLDNETSNESEEDEFEYDEDGNIIIPDVIDEDDRETENVEKENQGVDTNKEENEESDKSDKSVEPEETKPNEKDEKIAKLEAELNTLKSQGKETLSKLGVKTDDVLGGLEKLAAEADDISIDEYRKNRAATQRDEEARKLLQKVEFEKKMKADLAEVQSAYPETKKLTSIEQIENFVKFGMLRDRGLSPKEAYAAANADSIRRNVASAVKQQSLNETKNHLKSAVPKGSKDDSIKMPKSTLVEWRDLFPDKSDKEIVALYRNTIN